MSIRQKDLFKQYRIHPVKRLGQNFLTDKKKVKEIINAAEIKPWETILEIGPGLGVLTEELVKKAKKVVAVEKDLKMVEILKKTLKNFKNIEIINKDILEFDTKREIQDTKYKIIGNLPYYITAPIIRKFLEAEKTPKLMILTVQKEVGERICALRQNEPPAKAKKKNPKMSLLAVSVQFYAKPEIIGYISKKYFRPQPKVDSVILRIDPQPITDKKIDPQKFFQVVKIGFSQPRKQLINNFSKNADKEKVKKWLLENKIQPGQRAETLSVKDWINLTKSFKINQ